MDVPSNTCRPERSETSVGAVQGLSLIHICTGITRIEERPLTVTTALAEGWYVLREKDGYTDLDLFSTEKGKIESIIASNNDGRNLQGEARAIEFSYNYKAWDEVNERYVNTNSIFALSKDCLLYTSCFKGGYQNLG